MGLERCVFTRTLRFWNIHCTWKSTFVVGVGTLAHAIARECLFRFVCAMWVWRCGVWIVLICQFQEKVFSNQKITRGKTFGIDITYTNSRTIIFVDLEAIATLCDDFHNLRTKKLICYDLFHVMSVTHTRDVHCLFFTDTGILFCDHYPISI